MKRVRAKGEDAVRVRSGCVVIDRTKECSGENKDGLIIVKGRDNKCARNEEDGTSGAVVKRGEHNQKYHRGMTQSTIENENEVMRERVMKITSEMVALISSLYPSVVMERVRVSEVLEEALRVSDLIYGAVDAAAWAVSFEWDPGVRTRDLQRLHDNDDSLELLVRGIQIEQRPDRLNLERVQLWVPSTDPDYERIMQLATEGMRLLVDSTFVPNNRPPPMRELYRQVAKAVNSLVQDLWRDDLILLLPTATARALPGVHFSAAHWAPKAGKRCGRGIFDSSDNKHSTALNSDNARTQLEDLYGPIHHPTLCELVHMILEMVDLHGWENIVLWKGDLARAFTLLNFRASEVQLLACELSDGITMVYHSGLFGWVGTPYAFQVCTRVLERLIIARVDGRVRLYVDDVMGVSTIRRVTTDRQIAESCMTGLLGTHAVAEDKWEEGRELDFIGWRIDLNRRLVTLRRRNFLKTLYGFLRVDEMSPVSLEEMQRLSSWASRYSEVIRVMRPYTAYLYAETVGRSNRRAARTLRRETKEVIRLWRMVLILADLKTETFSRSIASFRLDKPQVEIRFDSSLQGVGLSLWDLNTRQIILVAASTFPFTFHQDSSHQNLAEFCAVVLAMAILARKGYRDISLSLLGDSVSALTWGQSENFRGQLNTAAAAVFVAIGAEFGFWVASVQHIAGEDNEVHDKLSRGTAPRDLGFSPQHIFVVEQYPEVHQLFILCNPGNELSEHWGSVSRAVSTLKETIRA